MIDWFYEYCCNIDGGILDCFIGSDCLRHEERRKEKVMSKINAGKLCRVIKRTLVSVPTHDGRGSTAFVLDPGTVVMITEVNEKYRITTQISFLLKMKEYTVDVKSGFESTYFEELS